MVEQIIYTLTELKEEPKINKTIKSHIDRVIGYLENDKGLGKDKAIAEIEDMVEKNNMEPHIRTQIWSVISMLESI